MRSWWQGIVGFLRAVGGKASVSRSETEQSEAQCAADRLVLYHSAFCLYCLIVRRAVGRLGVEIRLRDVDGDPDARRELVAGGGRRSVPCLRIETDDGRVRWMYESADIIAFLERRFVPAAF